MLWVTVVLACHEIRLQGSPMGAKRESQREPRGNQRDSYPALYRQDTTYAGTAIPPYTVRTLHTPRGRTGTTGKRKNGKAGTREQNKHKNSTTTTEQNTSARAC